MLSSSKKWLGASLLIGLILMVFFQFYLYKGEINKLHFINLLFLSGLTEACIGGLFAVIQTGVFDIVGKTIRYFWRSVSNIGRWVKENEMDDDEPLVLYDPEKRRRKHPLPLSCVWVGLILCVISFVLSYL
jgi:hypothetical protein